MKQSEHEMRKLMDGTGLSYQLGNGGIVAVLIAGLGPSRDRTQLVLVQNVIDQAPGWSDRDVMSKISDLDVTESRARVVPGSMIFDLFTAMLKRVAASPAGALCVVGDALYYRVDVPLSASPSELRAAIEVCALVADEMEAILTSGADAN